MPGRTTIIITHSPQLARDADRVVVLEDGRRVDDGEPARLLAEDGPYRWMVIEREPVPAPVQPDPLGRHRPSGTDRALDGSSRPPRWRRVSRWPFRAIR
jgi:energy-coupling factor transporter ATP-binding protein EcfA2